MTIRPLPKRPAPLRDELLSSWIARLAVANYCSVQEFCGYLGLADERLPETRSELQGVNLERFGTITRLSPRAMNSMLIRRCSRFPVECISRSDFQVCSTCTNETPGVSLRHWRYAWSTICNSCGFELLPVSTNQKDTIRFPPRSRTRALLGAARLKQAYQRGHQQSGRRVDLTIQVVQILAPELRHATLFSRDLSQRFAMLEALHLGLFRPMLGVAFAVRNDLTAGTRLHIAFPYKRKLLAQVIRLAGSLPNYQGQDAEKKSDQSPAYKSASPNVARPEYLAAAKQAISQLGETADRGELLRCAEMILETTRQQPVDIQ